MRKKYKRLVYPIGHGSDCGYANWLNGTGITNNIEEADVCIALGGSDVSSHYYNQPNKYLSSSPHTDKEEYTDFQKAISLKKKIVATCKGCQWGSVLAGGALFQHMEHPYHHNMTTFDGKKLRINSLHHNLCDLSKLKDGSDYKLLGWAENLSPMHLNGYGENVPCEKEPEVVYFPKVNILGFQNHNEMIYRTNGFAPMIEWSQDLLEKFMVDAL